MSDDYTVVAFLVEQLIDALGKLRVNFDEPMPDEDDRVFYEVTLSKEDSFLVTGNLKHYPTSPRVITPADFINII